MLEQGQWLVDRMEFCQAADVISESLPYQTGDEDAGRANALLALCLCRQQKWDECLAHADEATKRLPAVMEGNERNVALLLEAHRTQVKALYALHRRPAAVAAARILQPLAHGRDQGVLIDSLFIESLALEGQGLYREATGPLRIILALDDKPEWKKAPLYNIARLLERAGDYGLAKAACQEAIDYPGMDRSKLLLSKARMAECHIRLGERIPAVLLWLDLAAQKEMAFLADDARRQLRRYRAAD